MIDTDKIRVLGWYFNTPDICLCLHQARFEDPSKRHQMLVDMETEIPVVLTEKPSAVNGDPEDNTAEFEKQEDALLGNNGVSNGDSYRL